MSYDPPLNCPTKMLNCPSPYRIVIQEWDIPKNGDMYLHNSKIIEITECKTLNPTKPYGRLLVGFVWLNLYVFCVMVGRPLVWFVWLNL